MSIRYYARECILAKSDDAMEAEKICKPYRVSVFFIAEPHFVVVVYLKCIVVFKLYLLKQLSKVIGYGSVHF